MVVAGPAGAPGVLVADGGMSTPPAFQSLRKRQREGFLALRSLARALELKPGDTHARRVMGLALAQKGDSKRAIKELDRIVYLHDGRVTESGTHDELMALGGGYAHLYELQSKHYQ